MKILLILSLLLVSACANLAPHRERKYPLIQDLHSKQQREPSPYAAGDALMCLCPPGTKLFSGF